MYKRHFQYNANTGYHVYDYGDGSSTNFTRKFMSMSNPMSGFLYDTEKYLMDILNGKWYAKIEMCIRDSTYSTRDLSWPTSGGYRQKHCCRPESG